MRDFFCASRRIKDSAGAKVVIGSHGCSGGSEHVQVLLCVQYKAPMPCVFGEDGTEHVGRQRGRSISICVADRRIDDAGYKCWKSERFLGA